MRVNINSFFCLKNIELDINGKEIYFLGDSGSGKTKLLQAIAIALRDADSFGKNSYFFTDEMKPSIAAIDSDTDQKETVHLIGFGASRSVTSSDVPGDVPKFHSRYCYIRTLFERFSTLESPVHIIYSTACRQFITEYTEPQIMAAEINYCALKDMVADFTGISEMKMDMSGETFHFSDGSQPLRFKDLSDGLRGTLTLITNLFDKVLNIRLHSKYGNIDPILVLIDKIEQHLSATQQTAFIRKLRKYFPEVYFIVTTNSPTVVMGASTDAVFCKLQKKDGISRLVGTIPQSDIRKMMSNQLITSPLFGLDTAGVVGFDAVNASSSDYINQQIHEVIRKRLDSEPTLDSEEVRKWIAEEMDKLKPL